MKRKSQVLSCINQGSNVGRLPKFNNRTTVNDSVPSSAVNVI